MADQKLSIRKLNPGDLVTTPDGEGTGRVVYTSEKGDTAIVKLRTDAGVHLWQGVATAMFTRHRPAGG